MLQNILVAIDGSESANKALNLAMDLADRFSAKLVILNVFSRVTASSVVSFPTITVGSFPAIMEEFSNELRFRHEKMLENVLKKAKEKKPHLNISTRLVEGRPSDIIVETAKKENIGLIILGNRGLSSLKEFILGSVSDRVAHDAECSVLIVK